jgi:hypothetical protein
VIQLPRQFGHIRPQRGIHRDDPHQFEQVRHAFAQQGDTMPRSTSA